MEEALLNVLTRRTQYLIRTQMAYQFVTSLVKLSILCFYLRLADPRTERTFRLITYAIICVTVIYLLAIETAMGLVCAPLQAYWLRYNAAWTAKHQFHCHEYGHQMFFASSVVPVVLDFVTAFLPILLVRKLTLPLRQRVGMILLFGFAFCASIAAIFRSVYFYRVGFEHRQMEDSGRVSLWTNIEVSGMRLVNSHRD